MTIMAREGATTVRPSLPNTTIGPAVICPRCRMVVRRVELGPAGIGLVAYVEGEPLTVISDTGRVTTGRRPHDEARCAQLEVAGR